MAPDSNSVCYCQTDPSPKEVTRAKNSMTFASKLMCNMSVSFERVDKEPSGRGTPRYGAPDAPLSVVRSSPLILTSIPAPTKTGAACRFFLSERRVVPLTPSFLHSLRSLHLDADGPGIP